MFKIFFADDEPYVIEGLKIMVDWKGLDIEVVGEAADGETAFELIKKTSPDIVISDICMPGISGTELLEKCGAFRVKPAFVMLTGYGDMDYIRCAMKYGAKGYLMKPLDPEEITNVISGICSELSSERARKAEADEMFNLLMSETFQKIFYGESDREAFDKGRFLLGLKSDVPLMLIGYHIAERNLMKNLDEGFKKILSVTPAENACAFSIGCSHIFVINADTDAAHNRAIAEAAIEECTGISMIRTEGMSGLSGAYFAVMRSFTKIEEGVTIVSFIKSENVLPPDSEAEKVIESAVSGNVEEARGKLRADITRMKNNRVHFDFVRGYAVSLLIRMERYAGMAEINIDSTFDGALRALSNTYDYDIALALCEEFLEIFLQSAGSAKNLSAVAAAERITDYIKKNYADNITLVILSRDLGISTGVISKTVKQKTGMKFSDYLNYVRIQNAKKLLQYSNIKIKRIALESGYNDYYYFASKFKELTGRLPSDYRKKRRLWSENVTNQ